jgi:hypothetical protein
LLFENYIIVEIFFEVLEVEREREKKSGVAV